MTRKTAARSPFRGMRFAALALLWSACAGSRSASPPAPAPPSPSPSTPRPTGVTTVLLIAAREPLVDATFDREMFGGRPAAELASPAVHRAVEHVLAHLTGDAERCFAAVSGSAGLIVGASFVVEAGGRVTDARAEHPHTAAAACLERALTARTFPDPGRAVRHRIAHDFLLGRR